MGPTNEQPLHADINVGDTVYTGSWYLWGTPNIRPATVLKKASSGRLAVDGKGIYSKHYTDNLYFKSYEAALEHYKTLAFRSIANHKKQIETLEGFIAKCDELGKEAALT